MSGALPRVKLRCPKCRGNTIIVNILFTDQKQCIVENGVIKRAYITGAMPELLSITAHCRTGDCRHVWRARSGWDDAPETKP